MIRLIKKALTGKKGIAAMLSAALMVFGATSAMAAPVEFTGTVLPFTVPDMLSTAVNFLTMYGEWILLALGVIFAPVLYGLALRLISAVRKRSSAN